MQQRIINAHGEYLDESLGKRLEFIRALDYCMRAYDLRMKIYKEIAHQHLIESLKCYRVFNW